MYCEKLSPDPIIASHLLVYATAFSAAVVILCDTKLARVRGKPDSRLFLIPRKGAFSIQSVDKNFCGVGVLLRKKPLLAELCPLKIIQGHHVSSFEK